MTTKLRNTDLYAPNSKKLISAVIGLAIDAARSAVIALNPSAITDSSTGTAASSLAYVADPAKFYDASGTTKSPKTGFDTATSAAYDAAITLATKINTLRAVLGLAPLTFTGSPAGATVVAQTKALSATNGSGGAAVDYSTGVAELRKIRDNEAILARALNEVIAALGGTKFGDSSKGAALGLALTARAATATGVTGNDLTTATMADTAVDAVLLASANSLATLAAKLNAAIAALSPAPVQSVVYIG